MAIIFNTTSYVSSTALEPEISEDPGIDTGRFSDFPLLKSLLDDIQALSLIHI